MSTFMTTKEDLIARLQNGDTVDQIAEEMTKALNDAKAEYEAETKRKEEEKAKEDAIYDAKIDAAAAILDGFCDYLVAAGEDELLKDVGAVTENELIHTIDDVIDAYHMLDKMKDLEFKTPTLDFWKKIFG